MIIDIFAYLKHCEILQSTATEAQSTPGNAVALKLPLNVHCHMSQELEDYMLDTRLLSGATGLVCCCKSPNTHTLHHAWLCPIPGTLSEVLLTFEMDMPSLQVKCCLALNFRTLLEEKHHSALKSLSPPLQTRSPSKLATQCC